MLFIFVFDEFGYTYAHIAVLVIMIVCVFDR